LGNVTQVSVGRVGVFKGAVSLALQDGFLTNGEKRMLVKLSHTLRLDEDEPKAVYEAVISGTEIDQGELLALEETRRIYEQMLEAFLLHTDRSEGEVILVAYLRHAFGIDDSEHRAIARSLDRNLEQVVHRTVTEDIRMRLDDSMERISSIFDELRVKN